MPSTSWPASRQHELGPAHGIAVEEIGETPGPPEPGRTGGQDRERAEAVVAAFGTQYLEHCPDETVDLPRIGNPSSASGLEHRLAQRAGNVNSMFAATPSPAPAADAPSDLASSRASHRRMPSGRYGDPFRGHRVLERTREHLGKHRCERLHAAGAGEVEHERTLPGGCDAPAGRRCSTGPPHSGTVQAMSILLELDLTGAIVEDIGSHPVERVMNRRRLALRTLVNRLASAAGDPNVVGLLAKLGATSISLAQAQELADAVGRFRASGKEAIAWAETFGESGAATTAYVVATGFGELWLQPSGSVGLMGVAAAGTFVRGALDHAQVEPLFAQRYEYKNAADTFLRKEFTEAHREATERLAESAYEQVVSAVSLGRRLPADRVRELDRPCAYPCRRSPGGRARRSPRVPRRRA